jgi:hypothetical protein
LDTFTAISASGTGWSSNSFTDSGNNAQFKGFITTFSTTGSISVYACGTLTTNYLAGITRQYSGSSVSVDQIAAASNESATSLVGGLTGTTSQANETVLGVFGVVNGTTGATLTAGSGFGNFTEGQSGGTRIVYGSEDKTVSSVGTQQATASSNNAASGVGITLTLK